ncbi:ATP-binding protein [Streptomyces sp. NPDC059639]|uniref:ATP-binding protein n=1 Tax=Streptomyces sp. NPDC059639 TaxID=3346891 RepID=UPI0036C32728
MTCDLILLPRVAWRGQEITAPRLRGLLALLAGEPRTGRSTEHLVAGLWPEGELPERPGKAVQVLVSRVRTQLGPDVVVSTPTGYRLALTDDQVDSSALLLHAATGAGRARAGDHAGALAAAEAGLALWEGTPDHAGDDPVAALRGERAPVHAALVRARALALARLGRHPEAVGPLTGILARHPRDEEILAELLRAEAATLGPSAALTRFEAYRRGLRDELGTDPGPQLISIQQELLRGEAPPTRHGVPHEPNPLLGRDDDIAAVLELLRDSRAVTVVGPGGLGKTRLAHAVGRRAAQRLVHFVPLAGVTADADVTSEVASALGAGETLPGAPTAHGRLTGILGVLGTGPTLLVLDNCEQIVTGAADLVRDLLAAAPDLRVLATSRSPLDLTSEAVYALPELPLPTSVELFTQRARAARPGVDLPPGPVAELCRHLDGLPLAVELAAARVRVLSVPEIARRLGDRFALLRGGARDAPERHRTLHAVVDWSWNLLDEDARAALRTLSVFPGGFLAGTAERVLGADALFLLEELTGQSLVTGVDTPTGVRFRMLETVREFSAARRAEAGDEEHAVRELLTWAREFGEAHHDVIFGSEPLPGWERIKAEQDNLVLALRHALAREDGPTVAALTAVLAALWSNDAHYSRLAQLAADTGPLLSHYRPAPERVEVVRAATVLCVAALLMGSGVSAVRQLVVLRRLPAAPPDTLLRAAAVVLAAVPEMRPPDHAVLRRLCADGQPLVAGVAESIATYVWENAHDLDRAVASAHRMLTELAPADNPFVQLMGHSRLSELYLRTGNGDAAYEHLQAVLAVVPRLNDGHDYLFIRWHLVLACLQRADPDEAEYWLRRTEQDAARQQDAYYRPDLAGRAEIALTRGLTEVGLGLWRGAVEQMLAAGARHSAAAALEPWALVIQSVSVTAHAHADRLEPVAVTVGRLRQWLKAALAAPVCSPVDLYVLGPVLHALGLVQLGSDAPNAVRMIALAERLGVGREFQPTMSAQRARRAAENADRAAFTDAVSEYAALERDELGAAARTLTSGRG